MTCKGARVIVAVDQRVLDLLGLKEASAARGAKGANEVNVGAGSIWKLNKISLTECPAQSTLKKNAKKHERLTALGV